MIHRPDDVFRPASKWRSYAGPIFKGLLLCGVAAGGWWWHLNASRPTEGNQSAVLAEKRTFTHTLRRTGVILPLKERSIHAKLQGTILTIAEEGKIAKTGEEVLTLDPRQHLDAKAEHEEIIGVAAADYKSRHEKSLKILNLKCEDKKSNELKKELEQLRLDEIKNGPTPADEVNAVMNLENNKILLTAKEEELKAIESLARMGYVSQEERRQKDTEKVEQHFKVLEMDIAHKKLNVLDPVKVAEQELKVKEAGKNCKAAEQDVQTAERNMKSEDEMYFQKRKLNEKRLEELVENVKKTRYVAECDGLIVPRKAYYGQRFAAGRDVYDGMEILTIPDLSKMKVKLSVDEGHIVRISKNMKAKIVPAGWTGAPFEGTVSKIYEQGRDEFEQFQDDTIQISGTANRKVFDVEVELNDSSPILRLGLRCDVEIVLNQIENAVVVPRSVLTKQGDGKFFAPIAGPKGAVVEREIKVVDQSDLWAAVEGIAPGERLFLPQEQNKGQASNAE